MEIGIVRALHNCGQYTVIQSDGFNVVGGGLARLGEQIVAARALVKFINGRQEALIQKMNIVIVITKSVDIAACIVARARGIQLVATFGDDECIHRVCQVGNSVMIVKPGDLFVVFFIQVVNQTHVTVGDLRGITSLIKIAEVDKICNLVSIRNGITPGGGVLAYLISCDIACLIHGQISGNRKLIHMRFLL